MTDSEFLNEVEKELVSNFYENAPMREAVKKVLLDPLYSQGVMKAGEPAEPFRNAVFTTIFKGKSANLPNAEIGEKILNMYEGVLALEAAFEKMSHYKKVEEDSGKPKPNRAR